MKLKALAGLAALALILTGCGSSSSSKADATPSASATTNPYGGGFVVDAPADNDVVLTVSAAKSIDYTMGEIKKLAKTEIEIFEPFVKKNQKFTVVKMADFLNAAGFKATDKVNTVALNDYAFVDTDANFVDNNAYIAVLRDGQPIPMDEGGPIRIVFANDSKYASNLDAWNWSIRTMELGK